MAADTMMTRRGVRLSPAWATEAADWLRSQPPGMRAVGVLLGLILFVFSLVLLLGGGYTTIQGTRLPLAWLGVPVATAGIPALVWWALPASLVIIQMFCRHIPGLNVMWAPSYFYDGTTNTVFFFAAFVRPLDLSKMSNNMMLLALVGIATGATIIGFALAIVAERALIAASVILYACVRGPRR